ncbi:MAG: phosphoadenylyl-sulfate reductase [Gammaproteobacteria bacterium]|nr:phosphoadenylyl-sulfate reductase [Gammaproteobacteria bacterium]
MPERIVAGSLDEALEKKTAALENALRDIARDHAPAVLASSLGAEDMVLTDVICKHAPAIEIFTLDTGRLPEETYRLIQLIRSRYGRTLTIYFPRAEAVQQYVEQHGPNAFYESVELRKACCHMRKVEPLQRALKGKRAWITGLRRQQSAARKDLTGAEWDEEHGLHKFNPLLDWTRDEVWSYIRRFDVPYNTLHDKGYASIGCAPCTRAITAGEDERAGRWWWEQESVKECGLHVKQADAAPASSPAK